MVSLLKAWWGEAATAENDFCFDYLPRITGDHSHYRPSLDMLDGKVKGYFVIGENPAVGSANAKLQRLGAGRSSTGSSCATSSEIETRRFWHDAPEIETGELATEDIGTEVFFLPAAAHTEKDGSFTNTQRLLQWHHKAVEPPGRLPLRALVHLPPRAAGSARSWPARPTERDRPILDLTWDYPTEGRARRARAPRRCCARSTASTRDGQAAARTTRS